VFSPVHIEGRTLIDGGVVANLPVRQALELGATRVFVLPAIFGGLASVPSSALDMMQHSTMIVTAAMARRELEQPTQSGEVHVLTLPAHMAPRCSILMRRRPLSKAPIPLCQPSVRQIELLIH
jgi:NTE family protein